MGARLMHKFTLVDILNPTRLRDLLNKIFSEKPSSGDVKAGFGLSKTGDEISLGEYDNDMKTHVIHTPENDNESFLIGRYLEPYGMRGFFKTKGFIHMSEGDAMISIQDDRDATPIEGLEPLMDGKNRASLVAYRVTLLGQETITLCCSTTGIYTPALKVNTDNNVEIFNNDYNYSDNVAVNKKMLEARLKTLEDRIEALEAK